MEDYSRRRHEEAGYDFVNSPTSPSRRCSEKSGHLDWYADGMYPPMDLDAEYGPDGELKKQAQHYPEAMNCPMHNPDLRLRGRSHRELPVRLFEFGTVYRYEKSGVVQGSPAPTQLHPRTMPTSTAPRNRCPASWIRC